MPRRSTSGELGVYLNSRLVGRLRRHANGAVDFRYDTQWLEWEHAIAVSQSMPMREDTYTGERVIAVFDNLLPDAAQIRQRLAQRVGARGADAYSLLECIGRDCVGALQFLSDGEQRGAPGAVKGRPIGSEAIGKLIRNLAANPLGMDNASQLRISIAGAQEKTALLLWRNKWHVPHASTATTHILKPQIGALPNGLDLSRSVENEYLCLKLAGALGLPVANADIADFDGERVLVVKRFDRRWSGDKRLLRVPQEDLCQALSVPPTLKYNADGGPGMSEILELLKGSDRAAADRVMFLKAQIVFWLLGATDGHAKNFSIYLTPGGRFAMTPLYDIMSAQPLVDTGQIQLGRFKLALAVGDRRHYVMHTVRTRHFAQTAARNSMPSTTIDELRAELNDITPRAVDDVLAELPQDFPQPLADSVVGGIKARLPLLASD